MTTQTKSQIRTATRVEVKSSMADTHKLLLGSFGGKENKAVAAVAQTAAFRALLNGQAQDRPESTRTLLRAYLGLEGAAFDDAFSTFRGTLEDVAGMGAMATPHQWAAGICRARALRAVELKQDADMLKAVAAAVKLEKAAQAPSAAKLADKVARKLAALADNIEKAQRRLADRAQTAAIDPP
jgi:hypothetical protein